MKFKVECNWLLRTEEEIELYPKDFIHCATIAELNDEIEDSINNRIKYPNMEKDSTVTEEECLGIRYWDMNFGEFMKEWQKLKGLPEEL